MAAGCCGEDRGVSSFPPHGAGQHQSAVFLFHAREWPPSRSFAVPLLHRRVRVFSPLFFKVPFPISFSDLSLIILDR